MLNMFLTLIIGVLVAYLATQNTTFVTLPLFIIVLLSIALGIFLSSVVTLVNLIKSKWTILGQKGQLKKSYETVSELKDRVSELEKENTTLRDQINQLSPPREL